MLHRDEPAEGVAEQRPVLQLEVLREPLDGAREPRQRPLVRIAVGRVAVARQVGEQHAVGLREPLDAGQEHRPVEAGAGVQQQDGRPFAELADVHHRGADSARNAASAWAAVSGASS